MIAVAAIVLAILPFVFFRGAELIRALRNQFAVYVFATGVWVFTRTVGASDFDPYIAIVFIAVAQLALIALQLRATTQPRNPFCGGRRPRLRHRPSRATAKRHRRRRTVLPARHRVDRQGPRPRSR